MRAAAWVLCALAVASAGTAAAQPAPTQPTPVQPAPAQPPLAQQPAPMQPAPVQPPPTQQPTPMQPVPMQPVPMQSAPPPMPVPAPIAVLDAVAIGVDPVVGSAVTAQLRATAQALGYGPLPPDSVRSALGLLDVSGVPGADDARHVAERLAATRGVLATVRAKGGAYVVEIDVASAGGGGPWHAGATAAAGDLQATVDRLLRATLPPPGVMPPPSAPRAPAPDRQTKPTPEFARFRLALAAEGAYGVGAGTFKNYLAGGRLDYRFTPDVALGAYVAYANLKGRYGRTSNVLSYLMVDSRLRWSDTSPLMVPLRFAAGYLPKNGPFMRLSAGLGFKASDSVDVVFDIVAPTVWVTRDKPVVSLDLAAEVSFLL